MRGTFHFLTLCLPCLGVLQILSTWKSRKSSLFFPTYRTLKPRSKCSSCAHRCWGRKETCIILRQWWSQVTQTPYASSSSDIVALISKLLYVQGVSDPLPPGPPCCTHCWALGLVPCCRYHPAADRPARLLAMELSVRGSPRRRRLTSPRPYFEVERHVFI